MRLLNDLMLKNKFINPDWSAALWINYDSIEKPCGLMFAQEIYSDKQDSQYELFTQLVYG